MAKWKGFVVRLDEETHAALERKAQEYGMERAVLARQIIKDALAADLTRSQRDMLELAIRDAVATVLRPNVERLAKIGGKAAIMSASSYFLLREFLQNVYGNEVDIESVANDSRRKAVSYVREREADE